MRQGEICESHKQHNSIKLKGVFNVRARGHTATLLLRPSHNVITGIPKLYISLCCL